MDSKIIAVEKNKKTITPEEDKEVVAHLERIAKALLHTEEPGFLFALKTTPQKDADHSKIGDAGGIAYINRVSKADVLETIMHSLSIHPLTAIKIAAKYAEEHASKFD